MNIEQENPCFKRETWRDDVWDLEQLTIDYLLLLLSNFFVSFCYMNFPYNISVLLCGIERNIRSLDTKTFVT